jgi:RNA polymerase sigma factor (TIGR02999 family)
MDDTDSGAVTRLLHQWQQGDASCFDELSGRIYHELHRIAESYLRNSPNGTLQPTALINEAYMRLVNVQDPVQGRKHFFALAAKLMRQILVDRARRHSASKRGGGWQVEQLDEQSLGANAGIEEFLILEQALNRLSESEPRLAQVVELHYFGGLTGQEISEVLNVPVWTINRDHRLAEAWLRRALNKN